MMRGRIRTLSVTQLNRYVKSYLEEDPKLREVYVQGELSNVTRHYSSGHLYFTLKDETAAVRAVMFRGNAGYLQFQPENGMSVLVRAFVTMYERDGTYQLNVSEIQPAGVGALQVAYEQLKNRLSAEGLFDSQYKQRIPAYPKNIAVITSAGGAALQDVINILSRRCPTVVLTVIPAAVQGANSVPELLRAFRAVEQLADRFDTVILCRGGGSLEDLMSFNDERVVRAVFSCPVPVISAVGHEVDHTLCDFAADLRAPTPSAAAELAVPDMQQQRSQLAALRQSLRAQAYGSLDNYTRELNGAKWRDLFKSPLKMYELNRQRLDDLVNLLGRSAWRELDGRREKLVYLSALLDGLGPLKVLSRGYSITQLGGQTLSAVQMAKIGDELVTQLCDGRIVSQVVKIDEEKNKI